MDLNTGKLQRIASVSRRLRRLVVEMSARAHVGHIGSALCICDVLAVLFHRVMQAPGTSDPGRDRFILSKGHAAAALYAVLHSIGAIQREELEAFCQNGSTLAAHPDHTQRGVDFSTGSLGLGLSVGAGLALGIRVQGGRSRVFVLVSDAECNEGSHWEAVMFAAHHKLSNLVAVVDDNGRQALGHTREILDLQPLTDKWRVFGWDVKVVDGHDVIALQSALARAPQRGRPKVVIAKTILGKGVSFMEGNFEWHYHSLSPAQAAQALRELGGFRENRSG